MEENGAERVLVTGGAGFIGSHLCERLLARGDRVHCLDNFDPFYSPALKRRYVAEVADHPGYTLTEGDIGDAQLLERVFDWKPTVVVHLAALAGVRPSLDAPARYAEVNVVGTTRLLEACVAAAVDRFVFGSTSSVYGDREAVPFHEDERVETPASPYAATKRGAELVCRTFADLHQLRVTCLRFFTVYGPRQRPEMAIHKFVRRLFEGRSIPLFGDGSSSRDYTYVDDIVDGVVAAVDRPFAFEIVNLGNSTPHSLDELVSLIEGATGRTAERQYLPDQKGDVSRTWASIDKARELLDYQPRVELDQGIARFVAWYERFVPEP